MGAIIWQGGTLDAEGGTLSLVGTVSGGTLDTAVVLDGCATIVNLGTIDLVSGSSVQTQIFYAPLGRFGALTAVPVTWTQASAPTLEIRSAGFDNAGALMLEGGTLDLRGALFHNSGAVRLTDVATQTLLLGADRVPGVVDATLATRITVAATVTDFVNTGSMAADVVEFDNAMSLARLGAVSGSLVFAGALELGGGTLDSSAYGGVTISGTVEHGVVLAGGGQLTLAGATLDDVAVVGASFCSGVVTLANGAAVTLGPQPPGATPTIAFGHGPALLTVSGDGAGVTLTGLHQGDAIDFTSIAAGHATVVDGALEVCGASGQIARVALAGDAAGLGVTVSADAGGGTLVAVACFRTGTRIATPFGDMKVEHLRVGERVLTAAGMACSVRWLGRRAYTAAQVATNRQLRPVRIAAGALGGGLPRRALDVSPQHAMLVQGVLVPAGALVNGTTITRVAADGDVAYVHIELAQHDLVLAEGAAAETFVPAAGRAMFDNAAEYDQLYPCEPPSEQHFCLPRLECGETVERIRRSLGARTTGGGALRGHVERIAGGVVEGWGCDGDAGIAFDLLIDGRLSGRVVANQYRADLDHHGLPACGFRAHVRPGSHVALRRDDGALLAA